ncbi:2-oxo-4-hydroxy-4-carboxy-5-ureidoimidazoline (OHCU) decarboxylase [hydrothermal vent metagenome]|uniref:2-oxo-4-hydroxy-4-carboxy-5-ureidoimidazoline decarboxylase n=1 Tax=hydrothermal vent metagenome TaxID=652676 RepID=A0A3B0SNI5_9ZZZZ
MIDIETINALPDLVTDFGDIAEHAPWVAELASQERPFSDRQAMIKAFQNAILTADKALQLSLVRAHPDLAGKAKLTKDSQFEQEGAGLDTLTKHELARFTRLNDSYKSRFGFPFIFAVKGADKFDILESFEQRINNDSASEFAMALEMVCRIVSFRLHDKVVP